MHYRVFGRKWKNRIHHINPQTGETWCKAENNKQLGEPSDLDTIPKGRRVCRICISLKDGAPLKTFPDFRETEGSNCVLFEAGGRIITVGKQHPQFEETCAYYRRELPSQ